MPVSWPDIRYPGDARDVEELRHSYRIDDYLDVIETNRRKQDVGMRESLLKEGIRLTERLSPRIFRLYGEVAAALDFAGAAEVFCLPQTELNAFAMVEDREKGRTTIVGVTAGALERLEDPELRFVLGHELGHFIFETNRLMGLISPDPANPAATVLPPLGESLFLRWRKKAELSADRAGLIAARDFPASARALLKVSFGLSERNLNLDIEALLSQIDEIKGKPELIEANFASHPLLPIRLKALDLFSRSRKARDAGLAGDGRPLADDELESAVDELITVTRRRPVKPVHGAAMQAVAMGGSLLLGADSDVNSEEIKILIQILHHWFTDEPEAELIADRARMEERLAAAVDVLNRDGEMDDKAFVLSRLTEVALADGALMDEEGALILDIAQRLNMPQKMAYGIMVGGAQAVGFRVDAKLNRITEELRRSLQKGFRGRTATR